MSESDVVIRVEGLGKTVSLHHEQSERTEALQDLALQDLWPCSIGLGAICSPVADGIPT